TEEEPVRKVVLTTSQPTVQASAKPKPVESKKVEPVEVDPFTDFDIAGPLPVDDTVEEDSTPSDPQSIPAETVDSFSTPSGKPGASGHSDPFAPLPRKKPEISGGREEVLDEDEEVSATFFDDLSEYSGGGFNEAEDEQAMGEAEEPTAQEEEAAVASQKPVEVFSGFASLDDLEPFSPGVTREWPVSSMREEPKAPQPAPAPKAAKEKEAGGFFDELEAESKSPSEAKAQRPAASRPAPTPKAEKSVPPAPERVSRPSTSGSSLRDIELRAVFGTNEEFTFRRVADLTAGLPGVEACAIVGPGMVVQAPRGREAVDLASRAGSLVRSARELAEATGMANSETFTFHTEQGVISIFTHDDCCLTVSHAEGQFDPGVREKLILVARGLCGLEA
ncbi:MAG: hypothetical protein KDN19_18150, partial [Verrucomicrobiae bacterium]|nr:hypothetical protein [Verrucomicrobiae bacterium]